MSAIIDKAKLIVIQKALKGVIEALNGIRRKLQEEIDKFDK